MASIFNLLGGWRPPSKLFSQLDKILEEQGEEEADKFFQSLPADKQMALLYEIDESIADDLMQAKLASFRKFVESKAPYLGFSKD